MTPATNICRRAIELIERLLTNRFTALVQLLEFLSEPTQQAVASLEEVALIDVLQRCLPTDEQQQLNELRDRCEQGELVKAEREELIQYEDQLEQWRVECLEALIELAKLGGIALLTLNHHFLRVSALYMPSKCKRVLGRI
ncbi:hypothetical protein NDI45_16265 [Leptolyngbya sp. GB1-A1]|uniref:hypothetical protein n=1 Tax=Leptolyngbya sp. GB1-A1 TaxID=2933908 RepID=UPI00329904FC